MDYLPVIPIGNTGKSQANFHLGDNMVLQQQSEVIFREKHPPINKSLRLHHGISIK